MTSSETLRNSDDVIRKIKTGWFSWIVFVSVIINDRVRYRGDPDPKWAGSNRPIRSLHFPTNHPLD